MEPRRRGAPSRRRPPASRCGVSRHTPACALRDTEPRSKIGDDDDDYHDNFNDGFNDAYNNNYDKDYNDNYDDDDDDDGTMTLKHESYHMACQARGCVCLHFSICARHPCAGAMLIFSVSFQF